MKQRKVQEAEVLLAIQSPDETGLKTQPGRQRVRKHRNGRVAVDVVYLIKKLRAIIVTVIVTK